MKSSAISISFFRSALDNLSADFAAARPRLVRDFLRVGCAMSPPRLGAEGGRPYGRPFLDRLLDLPNRRYHDHIPRRSLLESCLFDGPFRRFLPGCFCFCHDSLTRPEGHRGGQTSYLNFIGQSGQGQPRKATGCDPLMPFASTLRSSHFDGGVAGRPMLASGIGAGNGVDVPSATEFSRDNHGRTNAVTAAF